MMQPYLTPNLPVPKHGTLTGRVFDVLEAKRGQWVDGTALARVGGYAGWSARVRDLRKLGYTVENRVRHVEIDGWHGTITEYRLL